MELAGERDEEILKRHEIRDLTFFSSETFTCPFIQHIISRGVGYSADLT